MKQCIICGKMFTPVPKHATTQITCSVECRKLYQQEYSRKDEIRARARERGRRNSKTMCLICGKRINRNPEACVGKLSTSRMHDSCVFEDCAKTVLASKTLTKAQAERLYYRGYTIKAFKKDLKKHPEIFEFSVEDLLK